MQALDLSISPFSGDGKAYSIERRIDAETGEFCFRLRILEEPDLVRWSLLIGDCLHNARSSLDHVFWALVEINNPGGISGSTSSMTFPILKDVSTFKGRQANLEKWIGRSAVIQIERLQPFNDSLGWNRNILSFLHDFDIMDKHKLLLPTVSIMEQARVSIATVENRNVILDGSVTVPLVGFEDGVELARLSVRNPHDLIDLKLQLTFQVTFQGQPGPLRVTQTLAEVLTRVEEVGESFSDFF